MAEKVKISLRGSTKVGCKVFVESTLFPEEKIEDERVYGVMEKVLLRALFRLKWADGTSSIMNEREVRFEKDRMYKRKMRRLIILMKKSL